MTIGLWVTAIIIGVVGLVISIALGVADYNWGGCIIGILITIIVVGATLGFGYWYYNNTAEGARALKDEQSNLNNGLMREIIITAEDGREIFRYKGKCDIETNVGYILFEGEDGLRRIIYYGALDTIIITELP
jgi:hypothetical protein